MTVKNLSYLFQPASVALIGASERTGSLGALVARNLQAGGFQGELLAVNPKYDSVQGRPCYRDVASLPQTPELAVIVTPPHTVPGLISDLAKRGSRAAVVITAGFGEGGNEQGTALQQAMLDAGRAHNFRILGPNCLGLLVPGIGLNASFAHLQPQPGNIAVLAQSGAILTTIIDWAAERAIGFSHLVSLGGMADVDFGDTLNYFAEDHRVHAILLYIESITQARKFMSAARAAARLKPVIVLKGGRFASGAKAAASHTGALAGRDDVYQAAFERAGMLRVYTIPELFDMVATLAQSQRPAGDRLAIVTNGGGIGVLAADALAQEGGRLAELSKESMLALDRLLPPTWSHGNPVDIIGDAPPERYAGAIQTLQQDAGVDAILALHCPVATASAEAAAQAVIDSAKTSRLPLLASWVGGLSVAAGRDRFARQHIPSYDSPAEAVHAFMQLVRYWRNQEQLMETPPSLPEQFSCDSAAAGVVIGHAVAEGRSWLSEREIHALFAAYAIPTITSHFAADAEAAGALAEQLDTPVALKIASPDITHKSDLGAVVLDLKGARQVQLAAKGMLASLREQQPDARLEGFTIQPMVHWPDGYELILGVLSDALFGPVLLFGHGGTAVEVINDKALALPPLNLKLARQLIARTRVARLLQGYRDRAPADLDAIALMLLKLSQLVSEQTHIAELDINPLLASSRGVLVLDARIRLAAQPVSGPERLAIRPYPKQLEQTLTLADGRQLLLRPMRAEDEPALIRGFQRLNMEEIRLRFHHPMKLLEHKLAARLTQIDYDREIAFVLIDADGGDIHAVTRLNADPDRQRAEFAIIVGHWMTGMGLGVLLMKRLIAYASEQGIGEMFGSVLKENANMLDLCRRLGFRLESDRDDPGTVIVRLDLQASI
jgi:acetyltransferase